VISSYSTSIKSFENISKLSISIYKIEDIDILNFNKVIYTTKANYRVEGQFTGNYWFEHESDGLIWWVDFKPIKIDVVGEDTYNVIKSIPDNEIENIINYVKWDYNERFEDPIWRCSRNNLSSLKSFYDPDWMVWSTYINVV
jgi:hypothetical protein